MLILSINYYESHNSGTFTKFRFYNFVDLLNATYNNYLNSPPFIFYILTWYGSFLVYPYDLCIVNPNEHIIGNIYEYLANYYPFLYFLIGSIFLYILSSNSILIIGYLLSLLTIS